MACRRGFLGHWTGRALPERSDVTVVDRAGHFLQLQPDRVADLVLDFIGAAAA